MSYDDRMLSIKSHANGKLSFTTFKGGLLELVQGMYEHDTFLSKVLYVVCAQHYA